MHLQHTVQSLVPQRTYIGDFDIAELLMWSHKLYKMSVCPCLKWKPPEVWCPWIQGYSLSIWGGMNLRFVPHTLAKEQPAFLPSQALLIFNSWSQVLQEAMCGKKRSKRQVISLAFSLMRLQNDMAIQSTMKPQCLTSTRLFLTFFGSSVSSPVLLVWDMLLLTVASGEALPQPVARATLPCGKRSREGFQGRWEMNTLTHLLP